MTNKITVLRNLKLKLENANRLQIGPNNEEIEFDVISHLLLSIGIEIPLIYKIRGNMDLLLDSPNDSFTHESLKIAGFSGAEIYKLNLLCQFNTKERIALEIDRLIRKAQSSVV